MATFFSDGKGRCPGEAAQLSPHALPLDGVAGPPHGKLQVHTGTASLVCRTKAGRPTSGLRLRTTESLAHTYSFLRVGRREGKKGKEQRKKAGGERL